MSSRKQTCAHIQYLNRKVGKLLFPISLVSWVMPLILEAPLIWKNGFINGDKCIGKLSSTEFTM